MAGFPFSEMDEPHHFTEYLGDEHGGINLSQFKCTLNPGHDKFLTIAEFSREHLPEECRKEEIMEVIENMIQRTVRIRLSYTSMHRPDFFLNSDRPYHCHELKGSSTKRCITGNIERWLTKREYPRNACCCPSCKDTPPEDKKESYYFLVSTATHGIFDDDEAKKAVFECFYDSNDRGGVECLYGICVAGEEAKRLERDCCYVVCVTHDCKLAIRLRDICQTYNTSCVHSDIPLGLLISHPHGASKRISIGKISSSFFMLNEKDSSPLKLPKRTAIFFKPGCTDFKIYPDMLTLERTISKLKCEVTVVLPTKGFIEIDDLGCVILPTGSQLTYEDGRLFHLGQPLCTTHKYEYGYSHRRFIEYDMASCPGSSGACVYELSRSSTFDVRAIHYGCRYKGKNISGLRVSRKGKCDSLLTNDRFQARPGRMKPDGVEEKFLDLDKFRYKHDESYRHSIYRLLTSGLGFVLPKTSSDATRYTTASHQPFQQHRISKRKGIRSNNNTSCSADNHRHSEQKATTSLGSRSKEGMFAYRHHLQLERSTSASCETPEEES